MCTGQKIQQEGTRVMQFISSATNAKFLAWDDERVATASQKPLVLLES